MSFVPPPPPGVVVPLPPAATPATTAAAASAPGAPATKVEKPGGVALDMSDLFGPPKNGKKKALPPWERKKAGTPPPEGTQRRSPATPPASTAKSPPLPSRLPQPTSTPVSGGAKLVYTSAANTSYPSLSSMPAGSAAAAPAAAVSLKTVPTPAAPVPPPPAPATTVGVAPPPAQLPAAAPPVAAPVAPAAPAPAAAAAAAGAVGVSPSGSPDGGVATAQPPAAVAQGSSISRAVAGNSAAVATSSRIAAEALRDVRRYVSAPSHTVVAPHVVFQGKEQQVAVMPLPPVPLRRPERGKAAAAPLVAEEDTWYNAFDVRPSPSCDAAYRQGYPPVKLSGACRGKAASQQWRGPYFQNVDVHRYITRRYLGVPPPAEL